MSRRDELLAAADELERTGAIRHPASAAVIAACRPLVGMHVGEASRRLRQMAEEGQ